MNEKCIKLRLEIVALSVMGPCNLNGHQSVWPGPAASIRMAYEDRSRMILQNIHNHICTNLCCLNADHIMIPHHCELQNQYRKLLRTEMLNEMSYWEKWVTVQYCFKRYLTLIVLMLCMCIYIYIPTNSSFSLIMYGSSSIFRHYNAINRESS
jgi:hypothetical protein